MKATKVDISPTVITGPADDMDAPRSPGLHLSQIYQSLEEDLGKLKAAVANPFGLPQLEVYRAGGFIWERAFGKAMLDGLVNDEWTRPGEFVTDGVTGSPDLISIRDWVIGETKFTWKSSKHLAEFISSGSGRLWVWGVQMKGYCTMIGAERARLFAYFVNGDYRNMQPQFEVYDFEFTPLELRENWSMLINHARKKGML